MFNRKANVQKVRSYKVPVLTACLVLLFPGMSLWAQENTVFTSAIDLPEGEPTQEQMEAWKSEYANRGESGWEMGVISLVNEQRVTGGFAPLKMDPSLMMVASFQAQYMSNPAYSNPPDADSILAELGFDGAVRENTYFGANPEEAVAAWTESNPNTDHTLIGVGVYAHPTQGYVFTQLLGGYATAVAEPKARTAKARRERGPFFDNRTFEFIFDVDAHFANDILTTGDIFTEEAVINVGEMLDGFNINFGMNIVPLSWRYVNKEKNYGFGMDIGKVTATGNMSIPDGVLNFKETSEAKVFGPGAAVFGEVGIPIFFNVGPFKGVDAFKVQVRPAFYTPLAHVKPGITYKFNNGLLEIDYDMQVFSSLPLGSMLGDEEGGSFNGSVGFDFGLDVQYPLFNWLDVGVGIVNMPFIPARVENYMQVSGSASFDSSNIGNILNEGSSMDDLINVSEPGDSVYGNREHLILRPFQMLAYAQWYPLEFADLGNKELITVIPSLGFSVNRLYPMPASIEGGLSGRLALGKVFSTTVGINYNDRRWINSVDLALNLRLFELGLGISSQSHNFAKSFAGGGFGVNLTTKVGW